MRKRSFKIISLCLFLLVSVFALPACSAPQLTRPTPDPSTTPEICDITGECSIAINGNTITVSGKTNFDKDVILNVSVEGQDGMTLDSVIIKQINPNEPISQDFTIDEKYDKTKVTKVIGHITCAPTQFGKQDTGILQKYGQKFECIKTDNKNYLWTNDGVVVVFASDMIELPE